MPWEFSQLSPTHIYIHKLTIQFDYINLDKTSHFLKNTDNRLTWTHITEYVSLSKTHNDQHCMRWYAVYTMITVYAMICALYCTEWGKMNSTWSTTGLPSGRSCTIDTSAKLRIMFWMMRSTVLQVHTAVCHTQDVYKYIKAARQPSVCLSISVTGVYQCRHDSMCHWRVMAASLWPILVSTAAICFSFRSVGEWWTLSKKVRLQHSQPCTAAVAWTDRLVRLAGRPSERLLLLVFCCSNSRSMTPITWQAAVDDEEQQPLLQDIFEAAIDGNHV